MSLFLALLALLSAEVASAELQPLPTLSYQLPNGLRVVLAPDMVSSDVSVAVAYDVGDAHDPRDYRGLAHLLEHLTFRGSRHLRPLEASAILDELGAGYNAFTAAEQTVYHTVVPTRGLETVLYIESERMGFVLDGFDAEALRLEKAVVTRELAEHTRSLSWLLHPLMQRALYGDTHPFTPALDEVGDVQAIDLPGVRWFAQRSYRPDNARLVVAGRFDPAQVRTQIDKYFADLENPGLSRLAVTASAPKLCGTRHLRVGHPFIMGTRLLLRWPLAAPVERTPLRALMELLEASLRQQLVHQEFQASHVDVTSHFYRSHAVLTIELALQESADADVVEAAVERELGDLALGTLSDEAVQRLRVSLSAEHDLSRELGLQTAVAHASGLDPSAERRALDALDATQLRTAAGRLRGPHVVMLAAPSRAAQGRVLVLADEDDCR